MTEEQAFRRLRELWPGCYVGITRDYEMFSDRNVVKATWSVCVLGGVGHTIIAAAPRKATLADCMAEIERQVKAAAEGKAGQ